MKQTKQDKQFKIQFDQANRDYLTNSALYLIIFLISFTALMISILSLVFSIKGISNFSLITTIVFVIILIPLWIKFLPPSKKGLKDAKKVNDQLQKELLELYPEYKERIH